MSTDFTFGVDWQRKGFICWDAKPGDALNVLPSPITYTGFDFRKTGVVTSAALQRLASPYTYGLWSLAVQTGTGVNNGFVLGQRDDLSVNTIPVSASTTYGVGVWLQGTTNYAGVPFILRVKNQAGATLFTSAPFNLTNQWQQVTVTGTTNGSTTHLMIEVIKNNHAADVAFSAAGVMLVQSSTVPTGYNAGKSCDLYDNLTDRAVDAAWFVGIHTPYQVDADDSILRLRLTNADKLFSPENASSPLAQAFGSRDYLPLNAYRPIEVRADDGSTLRTLYRGWVESIQPMPNRNGARTVDLRAAGPMLFLQDAQTGIPVQENQKTGDIVRTLLAEVVFPPALSDSFIVDVEEFGKLDESAFLSDGVVPNTLVAGMGKTTLAYAADNWVRPSSPDDDGLPVYNVYRAIKDTVEAERGRFFFDRSGYATFWDRHYQLLAAAPADPGTTPVFNDAMTELSYEYAGLDQLKNHIIVTYYPRAVSATSEELLWQLTSPITLQPGEVRTLTANYQDGSKNRIGAKEVHLSAFTFSQGSGTISVDAGANRATLQIYNTSGADISNQTEGTVLSGAELRGRKYSSSDKVEVEAVNGVSATFYGKRMLNLNIAAMDNVDDATSIANFELLRRSQPRGVVKTLNLRSHARDGGALHTQQLAQTIGTLVRVQESQTGHDALYFIIGEMHKITGQGEVLDTTWYLEAAGNQWSILERSGYGELGSETDTAPKTRLAY